MSCFRFTFTPLGPLFFSEGVNFDQDNEGLSEAGSTFPPSPHVLASASRALLARALGWDGQSVWNSDTQVGPDNDVTLEELVGSGTENWGALKFSRARIRLGTGLSADVIPVPCSADAVNETRYTMIGVSRRDQIECDLKSAERFRSDPDKGLDRKPAVGFVRENELLAKIRDDLGEGNYLDPGAVFHRNHRVGIEIDRERRTARSGLLYALSTIRMTDHMRSALSIEASVSETREAQFSKAFEALSECGPHCVGLGGRGTMSTVSVEKVETRDAVDLRAGKATMFLATPAIIEPDAVEILQGRKELHDNARIVAAAHERPVRHSSWSTVDGSRTSVEWRLPAGAVFSVDIETTDAARRLGDHLETYGMNLTPTNSTRGAAARRAGFGEVIAQMDRENTL